ncbi:MAG: hypothetical protein M1817_003949 [Caeruleum heppii]|nr:MAG: hypothetical protein M1817_003949 [Caeruleum heppii]
MKFSLAVAAAVLAGSAAAQNTMDRLMALKIQQREAQRARGVFDSARVALAPQSLQKCVDGKTQSPAGQPVYSCDSVDLHGFLSHTDLGSTTREGNDVWGWAAPNGREFGAVGQTDGTAFVEIKSDGTLVYLGRLPTQTESSLWRDMKVIDGYCYIGAEAPGHGLQVFDMRKLLGVRPGRPVTYDVRRDLKAWFSGFGSSHNIVAHEETNMIYAVGTGRNTPCKGGLFMVDVKNPAKPTSPGCASEDGYVHDAQCVIYDGPDAKYQGKEICFNYNEDTLTIMDVTSKAAPKILSRTPYAGSAYTHQGWLTSDADMTFLLLDDELDEQDKTGIAANGRTTTYIFNITQLEAPTNTGTYQSPAKAIDHNQYVLNGLSYQSNYGSGLRIVDVTSVEADPTGQGFSQAGFFDCHPEDDAEGGVVEFVGSWSVYPYFPSGYLLLNSIERGIYSLKYTG